MAGMDKNKKLSAVESPIPTRTPPRAGTITIPNMPIPIAQPGGPEFCGIHPCSNCIQSHKATLQHKTQQINYKEQGTGATKQFKSSHQNTCQHKKTATVFFNPVREEK
jgi:hypothetical protein